MKLSLSIRVNPEYEKLLPKLPPAEYEALKESIRREGMHYPIRVNREGVISDGAPPVQDMSRAWDTCEM